MARSHRSESPLPRRDLPASNALPGLANCVADRGRMPQRFTTTTLRESANTVNTLRGRVRPRTNQRRRPTDGHARLPDARCVRSQGSLIFVLLAFPCTRPSSAAPEGGRRGEALPRATHRIRRVISRASETSERAALPWAGQGSGDHRVLLGDQGPVDGDGRIDVRLPGPQRQPVSRGLRRLHRVRRRARAPVLRADVHAVGLLARGVDGRRVRDDGRRRAPRRLRRSVHRVDRVLRIMLAVVFVTWYRSEGTLSIHSVDAGRRELFYWAAVLATFAMGTAAGDLAAYTSWPRLSDVGAALRRRVRGAGDRLPVPLPERDPRVLDRLRPDAAAGRLVRRLDGQAATAGGLGWGDGPSPHALP